MPTGCAHAVLVTDVNVDTVPPPQLPRQLQPQLQQVSSPAPIISTCAERVACANGWCLPLPFTSDSARASLPSPHPLRLLCARRRPLNCSRAANPLSSYPRSSRNRPAHARGVSRCPASHFRTPTRGDKLNEDPFSEVAPGRHPNATPSSSTFGEQRRGLSDAVRSPAQSSSSPSSPQDRLL